MILGMSLGQLLIWAVILAAAVALVLVALRQFQIPIPAWVVQCFWIVVVAVVVVFLIRLLMSL